MNLVWECKHFDRLTPAELYAALRLRNEVFVVEQHCVFQDADNKDQAGWHVLGWDGSVLVAYSRILPPGVSYVEASIGRVVTSMRVRGSGVGKELMRISIERLYALLGNVPIRMGCQLYLKSFYESFGFRQASDIYLEDGIHHIEMLHD